MKYIITIITLAVMLLPQMAGAQDVPDQYIYFDVAAGPVTLNANYKGSVYVNGVVTPVSGPHNPSNKYYVYQSSTIEGSVGLKENTGYATQEDFENRRNCRIPNYPAIMVGDKTWGDYITGNNDPAAVISAWETAAATAKRSAIVGNTETDSRLIGIGSTTSTYDVTIDNIYGKSEYLRTSEINGASSISVHKNNKGDCPTVIFRLKGDNRIRNVNYIDSKGTASLTFTSYNGDNSEEGTLTVADFGSLSKKQSTLYLQDAIGLISGYQSEVHNLSFNGGTIYAGTRKQSNNVWNTRASVQFPIVIGGGSNKLGDITINGGRVTAISNGTSAAIGGGGGYSVIGGVGKVKITGGKVYAYAYGVYSTSDAHGNGVYSPCTAIGGGGTFTLEANDGSEVTITGGEVYAESAGGTAIGGGNSSMKNGSNATVTISGGKVTAVSKPGNISSTKDTAGNTVNVNHNFTAGTSIGGGSTVTGDKGGDATINISGSPTIIAGSVGGGMTDKAYEEGGRMGTAQVKIEGTPDIQAQFVLVKGASTPPAFTMESGTIHNTNTSSTEYPCAQPNGGAVYLEDGTVTLNGGTINNCSAENGGAIYVTGGTVYEQGTTITNNTATINGGGLFVNNGETHLKSGTLSGNSATLGGGLCTNGGVCYLYDAFDLTSNKIINTSTGSDMATVDPQAYFTLAENVNYGNICVQRGTAGHMIKLNGHSYNNYKARPDITLTGEGANGVLAVQDLEWVNVVNMIRDNETQNGGYSVNPDSPDRLLTDSRFTWNGDDATKTTTETYGMAYSRTDRPNRYGTVMLPFAATIMDNVTLYEIVSIEQGILSLHEVKEPERNKPYIYKIENADDESAEPKKYSMHLATNKNTQLAETELSASDFKYFPDNSRYQFIGKYTLQEQIPTNGDYDIYYFKNDGTTSGFYHKSAGTITVNPYRGYITLKKDPASPAPPRMLVLSFDDEATGIGCMQVNMADIVRTEYFSTDGTRLAAPLSHGITIIRHHYSDGTSDTRKVRGI